MQTANDITPVSASLVPVVIELGRTVEIGSLRAHRYADHYRIWDLSNAGKRGKRVRTASVAPSFYFKGDHSAWLENFAKALTCCESYDAVRRMVADLLIDFPHEIRFEESEQRGIDVAPGGAQTIEIRTAGGLEITASARDFLVKSTVRLPNPSGGPGHKQDTLYSPAGGKRAAAAACATFFAWLRSNLSAVEGMTIHDLRRTWDSLGVGYDFH